MVDPLGYLFEPEPIPQDPAPPMALGMGHVAQLLAAGRLDGLVGGDNPHVIRGVYYKEQYSKEPGLISERPVMYIRALYPDGRLEEYHTA